MRRPPNWSLLVAFEAVARTGGFSRAATELNVLQPAVSRRVAQLEAELGVQLVVRSRPNTALTPSGELLFTAVSESFQRVSAAVTEIKGGATARALVINTTIGFANCFLMKRLSGFRAAHADCAVELVSRDLNDGYQESASDVVFVFDSPSRLPGVEQAMVFREEMVAVCAPGYRAGPPLSVAALAAERLLHLTPGVHGKDWTRFFAGSGATPPPPGMAERYNSFMVYLQAALNGEGVALGWRTLMDDYFASGQLVVACERRLSTERGYFACLTAKGAERPEARSFIAWAGSLGEAPVDAPPSRLGA